MKRWLPFALYGAVALFTFREYFIGGKLLCVDVEADAARRPLGLSPGHDHIRVIDSGVVLPPLLRIYNGGLKEGELRLWNPYLFCGYPLYADPMVHPFYPPTLLLHAVLPTDAAYEINLLLHLFFSAVAMYAALRSLGRSAPAATLGGLVWMLGGYGAVWFSTGILLGASVFGPLALAAIARGMERRDPAGAARASLAMGLAVLGTHAQYALLLFLFLLGWAAFEARKDVAKWKCIGVFALLSVGIGLAAILTRLDSIEWGYRVESDDFSELYGRAGAPLLFVLGILTGKVCFPEVAPLEHEFTAYAGLATLALAVLGAVRGFREPRVRFAACFGGAAAAVAFLAPLALIWYQVPLLNLSPPSRWLFVVGFCVALLAARGVDALPSGLGRVPWAVGGLTGILLLAASTRTGPFSFSDAGSVETLLGFALALGAAGALGRRPRVGHSLGLAAVLVELWGHFLELNPHRDPSLRRTPPPEFAAVRGGTGPPRRALVAVGGRVATPELLVANNLLALHGVEAAAGFEAIIPADYVRFCREAGGAVLPAGRGVVFTDFRSRLLDVAAVTHVISYQAPPAGRFRKVGENVFENTEAFPRAYFRRDVSAGGPQGRAVTWLERKPHRFKVEVEAPSEGFLMISDAYYPGWEATVGGRPAEVLRANGAFRAVAVPAGKSEVELRFAPASARTGIAGSAAFLLLTLGLGILRRRSANLSSAASAG